jgi:hypothetical protein
MKFKVGDMVWVKVTSPCKSHFSTGMPAYVGLSYSQQYGGDKRQDDQFTILWCSNGRWTSTSWYDPSEFKMIRKGTDIDELFVRRQLDRNA